MYSDPKATSCSPCGDNIRSEPRDLDENPLAPNGTLVRATSSSCCECQLCCCQLTTSLFLPPLSSSKTFWCLLVQQILSQPMSVHAS